MTNAVKLATFRSSLCLVRRGPWQAGCMITELLRAHRTQKFRAEQSLHDNAPGSVTGGVLADAVPAGTTRQPFTA